MSSREHQIVIFGATGFTGALTAEYMARAAGGTRWALAGRNRAKLEAVRDRLVAIDPGLAELPLLSADIGDPGSLHAVAQATEVMISTVGPYIHYGEPVVAACAAAGTDYVDLTAEPEFVDRMWLAYHTEAERTGSRLVHSCGFDSIPYDLGVLFTVGQLPEDAPISIEGFVRAGGTVSGGTLHSAVHIMGHLGQAAVVGRRRARREGRPPHRKVRAALGRPRNVPAAGGWVVPFPTIDPQTVLRSARALDRYGPDFAYSHYLVAGGLPMLGGLVGGAGAAIALAQIPPTRKLLLKLKDPGDGPTPEQREKAWFRVRFMARTSDRRMMTEVSGGDPGYGETSKMLAESALCLTQDPLEQRAGQLTPAVAMGQPLIDRLQRAGIMFAVIDE